MKIRLPGVMGTMSLSFVFVLIGVAEFSPGECLLMGCLGALVQCLYKPKRPPKPLQVVFSLASTACAIYVSYLVQHAPFHGGLLTAATYFAANTLSVAVVSALTEDKNPWTVWCEAYFWTFPNYLVGAAAVWVVEETGHRLGWQVGVLLLPIFYIVYRSHRSYIDRLEEARKHAGEQAAHALEVAALHRRTIETLALAIEAKDQTTHDHLERVETYAIGVARELGLQGTELEALRAAALLHDIGKLAVPEYIIAKPGRLTPEEFEKMKTHTIVGAEIVERIRFPYPVAPLVRGHHEKWNGSGYPDGLAGEQIPLGARILAAVDCLDALASDRQYRRALPLDAAMDIVKSESGKHFDPAVVEILARRYVELDALAKSGARIAKLPTGMKVERGAAPAAGFEKIANSPEENSASTLDLAALQTALGAERRNDTESTLPLSDLMARVAECGSREAALEALKNGVRTVIPYDVMVVYVRRGEQLLPECVDGDHFGLFGSLQIPIGEGLSGWVAEHGKSIVNGNPDVEPGYLNDPTRFSNLRSALSVPLIAPRGIAGVLSLYRKERDVFTNENLAALVSLGTSVACIMESASPTRPG